MRTEHTGTRELNMADELRDDELRKQLQAYGVDKVGPITATTRSIYVKKLNHLRAADRKANKVSGRTQRGRKLAAFSSDESEVEESSELQTEAPRVSNRRRSGRTGTRVAPAPTSRPALRRRSSRMNADVSNVSTEVEDYVKPQSTSGARYSAAATYDFDSSDANDQDEDEVDNPTAPEMVSRSLNTSSFLDNSYLDKSLQRDTPSLDNSRSRRSSLGRSRPNSTYTSPVVTRNYNNSSTGNHLAPGGQSLDEKFLQYSNSNPRYNSYLNHTSHDKSYFSDDEEKIKKDGFKTEEETSWYSEGPNTSTIVLVLGLLFFLALALVYLGISFSSSLSLGFASPAFPQITNEDDRPLLHIYEVVNEHPGNECGNKVTKMKVTALEDQYCSAAPSRPACSREIEIALKQQHKYYNSSDLPLKLYDEHGMETNAYKDAVYITAPARLSLWCRLLNSAHLVAYYSLLTVLVFGGCVVAIKSVHYYKKKKDEETKRVIDLVEKIIEILRSHHEESMRRQDDRDFVAISHVRDMLIPIQERKRLQPLWDKAVKFLSANESRVRVETQKIAGEEFAVWRWLQVCANGNKVWQGQAFGEHKDLALNSAPHSYTPCLKIRNMFDVESECEDDWHIRIQDAILEKCGDNHGIVHIAVDKASKEGCVYVKCTSNEYSGKAYKALHGWWFNGSLVTVKYLRLERYHERFPDAKFCIQPMQPSNNKCLSLSQPFHRSVIEFS